MGIACAENGKPIVVNADNGLPEPNENGDYPLVVYSDWFPQTGEAATPGSTTEVVMDGSRQAAMTIAGLRREVEGRQPQAAT